MSIRSIFTSDILYNENTLPKEMNFKLATQKDIYLDHYSIHYHPENLVKQFEIENIKKTAE